MTTAPPTPRLEKLTVASQRSGIGYARLRRLIADGELPAVRIGRLVMIEPVELDKLIANSAMPTTAKAS